jgi:hypothetical protein
MNLVAGLGGFKAATKMTKAQRDGSNLARSRKTLL